MGFPVSAGVNVSEVDLTTVVPAVSTTVAAIAGVFRWGPIDKVLLISSEDNLAQRYGKPSNYNAETWFGAANFLSYGDALNVSRAANTTDQSGANGVLSAIASNGTIASNTANLVKNEDHYLTLDGTFDANSRFIAKYPGALGNSLKISSCSSGAQFASNTDLLSNSSYTNASATAASFTVGANTANVVLVAANATITNTEIAAVASVVANTITAGDLIKVGNSSIGVQYLRVTSVGAVQNTVSASVARGFFNLQFESLYTLSTNVSTNTIARQWEYSNVVDTAPGQSNYVRQFGNTAAQDELHVVVTDEDGQFTGVPGTILEVYERVSRASDAKSDDGASIYYKTVLNNNSRYVWFANARSGSPVANAAQVTTSTDTKPSTMSFTGGSDGADEANVAVGILTTAWDKFKSAEDIDVSLLIAGKARGGTNGEQLANYLIDNIAESRRDCVVFVSPEKADVVNNSLGDQADQAVTFRNSLRSSSYYVLDSGYKQQYDKYNDLMRYVPLNGDIAGLCARTDNTNDPWWSPGGFNRGQIKNIVKLAWNPGKAERDLLYKNGVNPVVNFPGQGTILYGDKTGLAKPSAFDRINVRRLFIVLEKAIATAAKFTLFEFNDDFTRAQFRALVEPFLRDVQGRRGIYDFRVVCDATNNTSEVIDRNEFVGDIYIKPAKSINYIQLNFVAVRSGVEFDEIVGRF